MSISLTVLGKELQFREPGMTEWRMYLTMSKSDDMSATLEFVKASCTSHDGKTLQAIFEKKPLALNKCFNMIFAAMQEGIEEKK